MLNLITKNEERKAILHYPPSNFLRIKGVENHMPLGFVFISAVIISYATHSGLVFSPTMHYFILKQEKKSYFSGISLE